ncbi:MAG: hypothetical protein IJ753_04360 [Bacteroidales bacterium]|nr:hypothetical protein [Bacteroidales bacterium]
MKKNFLSLLFLTAATSLIFSCNKSPLPTMEEPGAQARMQAAPGGMMVISVSPDNNGTGTKADGNSALTTSESVITSLQVFVFYGASDPALNQREGCLETDVYDVFTGTENTRVKTITTTVGQKFIYALANAPRLRNVTSIEDLKKREMYLGNNYLTLTTVGNEERRGLVMAGAYGYSSGDAPINIAGTRKEITAYSQNNEATLTTVPINLYRLAAHIEIDNLAVDFRGTDLEGKDFVLKEIYLNNVPNTVYVSGQNADLLSSDATCWSNPVTREASPKDKDGLDVTSLVYEQMASGGTNCNTAGGETSINSYFYCYPNPIVEDDTADSWSQRRTRLVIHATIDGKDNFYPVNIADPLNFVSAGSSTPANNVTHSQIVGNHKYVIKKITITSQGNPDDKKPIVTGKAKVNVSVQEWSGSTTLEYEI